MPISRPIRIISLRRQFDAGVKVIEKLIEAGIATGEFYCEDPKGAAANIMYVLEGLKINAQTFGISEKMVDGGTLYYAGADYGNLTWALRPGRS